MLCLVCCSPGEVYAGVYCSQKEGCRSKRIDGSALPWAGLGVGLYGTIEMMLCRLLHHSGCRAGMVNGEDIAWHLSTTNLSLFDDHCEGCSTTPAWLSNPLLLNSWYFDWGSIHAYRSSIQ